MSEIHFTVSGPPVGKQRPRTVGHRNRRGEFVGVRTYTPAPTRRYEQRVAWEAIAAGARRAHLEPPFGLEVHIWFPDLRRRDVDQVGKLVMDALTLVVWQDDSQVVDLRAVREEVDRENPRIEVIVRGGG